MQGHAVQGRGHAVLPDAEMEDAAQVVVGLEVAALVDQGVVGAGQVGRAAVEEGLPWR